MIVLCFVGSSFSYSPTSPQSNAVAAAAAADIAIICTATTSGEGHDRPNLSLPSEEDELIAAVLSVQQNTIVVVTSPGAVLMPWADSAAAIVATFMPGQEAGNAVADVLFGRVNPSGKLPLTFPMIENQVWPIVWVWLWLCACTTVCVVVCGGVCAGVCVCVVCFGSCGG